MNEWIEFGIGMLSVLIAIWIAIRLSSVGKKPSLNEKESGEK